MNIKIQSYKELLLGVRKDQLIKLFDFLKTIDTYNFKSFTNEVKTTNHISQKDQDFIVDFLKSHQIIRLENNKLLKIKDFNSKELFVKFAKYLFNLIVLNEDLNENLLLNSEIKIDDDYFLVNIKSIDLGYRKIFNTLSNLEMVEHDNGFAKITNYMVAKKLISRTLNKLKKSQKEFEKELFDKAYRGNLAEEFVLNYEKEKLIKTSLIPLRVSIDDVGLGYDILSFDEKLDEMFIEVKSISNNRFYWSENEIKSSREYGDKYYIYCVKFKDGKPLKIENIINNPFKVIFEKKELKIKPTGDYIIFLNE